MEIIYFKSSEEKGSELLGEWNATQEENIAFRKKITEKWGSDGICADGQSMLGLFKHGGGHKDIKGLKRTEKGRCPEDYTLYEPDRRCKAGKELQSDIMEYGRIYRKAPKFSSFILKKFNFYRMVRGEHRPSTTGLALYFSVAGYVKGVCVIKLPCDKGKSVPDAPEGFEQIKKSEFIALTEE